MRTQTKRKVRRTLGATNGEPLPVAAKRVNDLAQWRAESFQSAMAALKDAIARADRAEAKLAVVQVFLQRHFRDKGMQLLAATLAKMDAKNAKGQDQSPSP